MTDFGFGLDDESCLGLSDDERDGAPQHAPQAPLAPAEPQPHQDNEEEEQQQSEEEPKESGQQSAAQPPAMGSGLLALKALQLLHKSRTDSSAASPPPRPPQQHQQQQLRPQPERSTQRRDDEDKDKEKVDKFAKADEVCLPVQTRDCAIPGPAGAISPDAALVPPTQFVRSAAKKKRVVARRRDSTGRAVGVGRDARGLFVAGDTHSASAAPGGSGERGSDDDDDDAMLTQDASLIVQSKLTKQRPHNAGGTGSGSGSRSSSGLDSDGIIIGSSSKDTAHEAGCDSTMFQQGAWLAVLESAGAYPFGSTQFGTSVAHVQAVGFRDKVERLAVVVAKCVDAGGAVRLTLCDVTGSIDGMLPRTVALQHPDIGAGTGLVLCNVSVFSTSPTHHMLNIVASNIELVVPPGSTVDAHRVPPDSDLSLQSQRKHLYHITQAPLPQQTPRRQAPAPALATPQGASSTNRRRQTRPATTTPVSKRPKAPVGSAGVARTVAATPLATKKPTPSPTPTRPARPVVVARPQQTQAAKPPTPPHSQTVVVVKSPPKLAPQQVPTVKAPTPAAPPAPATATATATEEDPADLDAFLDTVL